MTRDPIIITPHNDVFLLNRDASNTPVAIAYTKETALLIAAQDDMLAALKNLLAGCPDETFKTGERLRSDEAAFLNGAIFLAKSAIAKAEGRS